MKKGRIFIAIKRSPIDWHYFLHSADCFLSLAWPFVSLTLSSLALCTIATLKMNVKRCNDQSSYLFFAEMLFAISAAKVLLFISNNSISLAFLSNSFLKPMGIICLVLRAVADPILGHFLVPLYLRRVGESIP